MNAMRNIRGSLGAFFLLAAILAGVGAARASDYTTVELQLIWGTDDATSPDPAHKPVDPEIAKQLQDSPFRWKHYFVVSRRVEEVPVNETKKNLAMSQHCSLDIKNFGKDRFEVKLYGDGKLVSTDRETLPLLLAGDAKNSTAWMVLIRKVPDSAGKK